MQGFVIVLNCSENFACVCCCCCCFASCRDILIAVFVLNCRCVIKCVASVSIWFQIVCAFLKLVFEDKYCINFLLLFLRMLVFFFVVVLFVFVVVAFASLDASYKSQVSAAQLQLAAQFAAQAAAKRPQSCGFS